MSLPLKRLFAEIKRTPDALARWGYDFNPSKELIDETLSNRGRIVWKVPRAGKDKVRFYVCHKLLDHTNGLPKAVLEHWLMQYCGDSYGVLFMRSYYLGRDDVDYLVEVNMAPNPNDQAVLAQRRERLACEKVIECCEGPAKDLERVLYCEFEQPFEVDAYVREDGLRLRVMGELTDELGERGIREWESNSLRLTLWQALHGRLVQLRISIEHDEAGKELWFKLGPK